MASSGSCSTNEYSNRGVTFNWWTNSQNTTDNYTEIGWNLKGSGSNSGYIVSGNFKVTIDGENVYNSSTRINLYNGTEVASGTKKIYHNSDGTKNFGVSLEAGIYTVDVNCTGSGSWDLDTIPRYFSSTPVLTLVSKTETSYTFKWTTSENCNYVRWYFDNSSSWHNAYSGNAKSGTFIVNTGDYLTNDSSTTYISIGAYTSHSVCAECRRDDSGLWSKSNTSTNTTYQYPYVSAVNTSNLIIGNSQKLTLYNPLSRSVTVYMKKDSTSGTQLYSGTTSSTSITFTPDSGTLYKTIPSATSANCVYYFTYSSKTIQTKSGTYSIKGTETPTFSNFTYQDTNSNVVNVTGDNQIIVKGLSTLRVLISSSNKMTANYNSTAKSYTATIDNINKSENYTTSDLNIDLGTISSSGSKRLNVRAYDTRNLSTLVYKDITVYDYNKPVINATLTRLNNFENETTITVSGTYSKLTINNSDKNTLIDVKYRYRESGGTWSDYIEFTVTLNDGKFTCDNVILSLDNSKSFEFEIVATDNLSTTTNKDTVDIGKPIFMISSNKKACYINGQELIMYETVDEW
jgi:hypothetical protein